MILKFVVLMSEQCAAVRIALLLTTEPPQSAVFPAPKFINRATFKFEDQIIRSFFNFSELIFSPDTGIDGVSLRFR